MTYKDTIRVSPIKTPLSDENPLKSRSVARRTRRNSKRLVLTLTNIDESDSRVANYLPED